MPASKVITSRCNYHLPLEICHSCIWAKCTWYLWYENSHVSCLHRAQKWCKWSIINQLQCIFNTAHRGNPGYYRGINGYLIWTWTTRKSFLSRRLKPEMNRIFKINPNNFPSFKEDYVGGGRCLVVAYYYSFANSTNAYWMHTVSSERNLLNFVLLIAITVISKIILSKKLYIMFINFLHLFNKH
jgi:hypothetical protein